MMGDLFIPYLVKLSWMLWVVLGIVWGIAAFGRKKPIVRDSTFSRLTYSVPLAFGLYGIFGNVEHFHIFPTRLYQVNLAIVVVSFCLVAFGVLISIWSRFILGTNWSSAAEIKPNHELVASGPYRYARHPIYVGFLVALFGTALEQGSILSFSCVAICVLALSRKIVTEESLLVQRFGPDYSEYIRQVPAIPPFLW